MFYLGCADRIYWEPSSNDVSLILFLLYITINLNIFMYFDDYILSNGHKIQKSCWETILFKIACLNSIYLSLEKIKGKIKFQFTAYLHSYYKWNETTIIMINQFECTYCKHLLTVHSSMYSCDTWETFQVLSDGASS